MACGLLAISVELCVFRPARGFAEALGRAAAGRNRRNVKKLERPVGPFTADGGPRRRVMPRHDARGRRSGFLAPAATSVRTQRPAWGGARTASEGLAGPGRAIAKDGATKLDVFRGNLARCASSAAVLAVVEDAMAAGVPQGECYKAVLDRLALLGASVLSTKIVLRRLGLDWMQQGPAKRTVIRLQVDALTDAMRWQHKSAVCMSFEGWRSRRLFSVAGLRPAAKAYVFFNAAGEMIGWQAG